MNLKEEVSIDFENWQSERVTFLFCLIFTLYIVATCIFHKNRRPLFVFCNPVLSIPAGGFCV